MRCTNMAALHIFCMWAERPNPHIFINKVEDELKTISAKKSLRLEHLY